MQVSIDSFCKKIFEKTISKIDFNILVLTDGYSNLGTIFSARKVGKYVIELQHGLITPNIPSYHFPNIKDNYYLPSEILLFSEKWMNASSYAINQNIGTYNSMAFSSIDWISKPKHGSKKIILVGQKKNMSILLDDLSQVIGKFIESDNVQFFLKLHPRDSKDNYKYLMQEDSPVNVLTFEQSIEIDKAIFICGNSTTIFQLATLGFNVLINNFFLRKNNFVSQNQSDFIFYNQLSDFKNEYLKSLFAKREQNNLFFSDKFSQGTKKVCSNPLD